MSSIPIAPSTRKGKTVFKPMGLGNKLEFTRDVKNSLEVGMSSILGYTFKYLDDKLYFNIGLGFAAHMMGVTSYVDGTKFNSSRPDLEASFGIPIQAGVQYFFTKAIGIHIMLGDEIGVNIIDMGENNVSSVTRDTRTWLSGLGFSNVFPVKVVPYSNAK